MGVFKIIPSLLKKDSSKEENNYLSLTITPEKVQAYIWRFGADERIEGIGYGEKNFKDTDDLEHQTAVAIDTAGETAKSDVEKVVFGLSQSYLEDSETSKSTSELLKTLSADLEIEPQAFVSLAAATNHFLKVEESITPQVIALGIFDGFAEAHLLENNKVQETKVAKGPADMQRLTELLKLLKKEKELPARIIIFGLGQESDLGHQMSKHNWGSLFVHHPKIDFLTEKEIAKAVSYAQAADLLGHDPIFTPVTEKEKPEVEVQETRIPNVNEFGFIEGEDILKKEEQEAVFKEDIKEEELQEAESLSQQELEAESNLVKAEEPEKREKSQGPGLKEQIFTLSWLSKITDFVRNKKSSKIVLIVVAAIIATALIGSYVAGQYLTSAQIDIKVNSKSQDKEFSALVITGQPADPSKSELGGQAITERADGSQKAVTTGTKKIGNQAHGEITVFNLTSEPKTFTKGTTIISKDGLKFTLDDEIEATSASKPSGTQSNPGKVTVKVTATESGGKYNLQGGQDFSFTGYDEYFYWAHNDLPFGGGDEKQITVVSKADMDKLEKSLTETNVEKAKNSLKEKSSGEKILDDAITTKIISKEFDKKLDDEASLLNLNLSVEVSAITFNEDKLKELLSQIYKNDFPANFEARPQDISISKITAKRQDNKLKLTGKLNAKLVPKLKEDELKAKIAGKSIKDARSLILQNSDFSDVNIKFTGPIPFVGSVPQDKSKIHFQIEAI